MTLRRARDALSAGYDGRRACVARVNRPYPAPLSGIGASPDGKPQVRGNAPRSEVGRKTLSAQARPPRLTLRPIAASPPEVAGGTDGVQADQVVERLAAAHLVGWTTLDVALRCCNKAQ